MRAARMEMRLWQWIVCNTPVSPVINIMMADFGVRERTGKRQSSSMFLLRNSR